MPNTPHILCWGLSLRSSRGSIICEVGTHHSVVVPTARRRCLAVQCAARRFQPTTLFLVFVEQRRRWENPSGSQASETNCYRTPPKACSEAPTARISVVDEFRCIERVILANTELISGNTSFAASVSTAQVDRHKVCLLVESGVQYRGEWGEDRNLRAPKCLKLLDWGRHDIIEDGAYFILAGFDALSKGLMAKKRQFRFTELALIGINYCLVVG